MIYELYTLFTIFDCLSAHLQQIEKPQTHHICFRLNMVNHKKTEHKKTKKGMDLGQILHFSPKYHII